MSTIRLIDRHNKDLLAIVAAIEGMDGGGGGGIGIRPGPVGSVVRSTGTAWQASRLSFSDLDNDLSSTQQAAITRVGTLIGLTVSGNTLLGPDPTPGTAARLKVGGDVRVGGVIYATDFVLAGGSGGTPNPTEMSLGDLDDVEIGAGSGAGIPLATGHTLGFDGSVWRNAAPTGGGGGDFGTQPANTFFAAPDGAGGVPGFRAITVADLPLLPANRIIPGDFATGAYRFPTSLDIGTIPEGTPASALRVGGVVYATDFVLLGSGPGGSSSLTLEVLDDVSLVGPQAAGQLLSLVDMGGGVLKWRNMYPQGGGSPGPHTHPASDITPGLFGAGDYSIAGNLNVSGPVVTAHITAANAMVNRTLVTDYAGMTFTHNHSLRWYLTMEPGATADLSLNYYNDSGGWVAEAFHVSRSTGTITIPGNVVAGTVYATDFILVGSGTGGSSPLTLEGMDDVALVGPKTVGQVLSLVDMGGGVLKWRNTFPTGGAGNVSSVFGRTGAVVAVGTDYASFYPGLTGANASGTWGIAITGNAGTVTNGVYTTGSYSNPAWITALAASKITAGTFGAGAFAFPGTLDIGTIPGGTPAGALRVGGTLRAAGDIFISKATPSLVLDRNDNGFAGTYYYSQGAPHWYLTMGLGAAADFELHRYDDAGAHLGQVLQISRTTGTLTYFGDISAAGTVYATDFVLVGSGGGGSSPLTLEALDDVDLAAPQTAGQVLSLVNIGGGVLKWRNAAAGGSTVSALGDLTDVSTAGTAAGHALMRSTNGWVSRVIEMADVTGTLPDARLSANVSLLNRTARFGNQYRLFPEFYNALTQPNPDIGNWQVLSTAIAAGMPLYADEEFAVGINAIGSYNNQAGSAVTVTRIADATAPNATGMVVQVAYNGGSVTPGVGGFYQLYTARLNATFVQRFRAKIPTGYSVASASNSLGTGGQEFWLTPTDGTGRWEEYVRVTMCGNGGAFDTAGFVWLVPPNDPGTGQPIMSAMSWRLASCNVYEVNRPGILNIDAAWIKTGSLVNPSWLASLPASKVTAGTFAGSFTFSSTISGSITGNAGSVTNGIYTTTLQSALNLGQQRIGVPVSYGSVQMSGATNDYAGIWFSTPDRFLMVGPASQGMLNGVSGDWIWAFTNGSLAVGTVPAARITEGTFGTGNYTFPANLTIAGDGRAEVWFGMTSSGVVQGHVHCNNAGNIGFANAAKSAWFLQSWNGGGQLHGAWLATGNLTATDFVLSSDMHLKLDIAPITDALAKLDGVGGYTYTGLRTGRREAGVLAQEIRAVLPEAVSVAEDGYLGVAYDRVIPLLIAAIKELRQEVAACRAT
jgi:hypothetical protein